MDAALFVSLVDAVCTQTLLSPPKAVCVQIIVVVCADAAFARNTGRVDEVGVVLLAPPRLQETRKGVGLTDYFMITPDWMCHDALHALLFLLVAGPMT